MGGEIAGGKGLGAWGVELGARKTETGERRPETGEGKIEDADRVRVRIGGGRVRSFKSCSKLSNLSKKSKRGRKGEGENGRSFKLVAQRFNCPTCPKSHGKGDRRKGEKE